MKCDSVGSVILYILVVWLEIKSCLSDEIIFPESDHHQHQIRGDTRDRQCIQKHGVCVGNVQGYPSSETIRRAMEPHKELLSSLETRGSFQLHSRPVSSGYSEACSSKEDVMYPQEGYDKDGVPHHIVNDGSFNQPVTLHACSAAEKPCSVIAEDSKCVQQKRFLKLAVINSSEMIEIRSLRMPSHCSCYINSTVVGYRFGEASSNSQTENGSQQTPSTKSQETRGQNQSNTRFPETRDQKTSNARSPETGEDATSFHDSQIQFVDRPVARRLSQERWRRSQSESSSSSSRASQSGVSQPEVSGSEESGNDPSGSSRSGESNADRLVSTPNNELSLSVADQPGGFSSEIVVDSNVLRIRKRT